MVTVSFTSQSYTVQEDNGTVTICVKKDTVVEGVISLTVESYEKDPLDAQGKGYISVCYFLKLEENNFALLLIQCQQEVLYIM